MASLRKAGAYSKKYTRPYTRKSKKRTKSYIKTVPQMKIAKFNMGNLNDYKIKKYKTILKVVSTEKVQIRDNALEAARQTITRGLDRQIKDQYYFQIKVYPHHILRENKMLTAAGADRMQTGMQKSFGKVIGRAALVNSDQEIMFIATAGEKQIARAKSILKIMKAKLPCKVKIVVEQIGK